MLSLAGRVYVRRSAGSKLFFYDIRSEVCLLRSPTVIESHANSLQGTRLQVLAQADNREEGTPDFEEQHVHLRRGDIIGSCMKSPTLSVTALTRFTRHPRLPYPNQPQDQAGFRRLLRRAFYCGCRGHSSVALLAPGRLLHSGSGHVGYSNSIRFPMTTMASRIPSSDSASVTSIS